MTERMITTTIKMSREMIKKVDELARLKGMTRSELIRQAIELYLKNNTEYIRRVWEIPPKKIRLNS